MKEAFLQCDRMVLNIQSVTYCVTSIAVRKRRCGDVGKISENGVGAPDLADRIWSRWQVIMH